MFQILFEKIIIDTVKNIVFNTLRNIFKRKKLLTERKIKYKSIGYARATSNKPEYLEEQIESLQRFGCNYIFSENVSLSHDNWPQRNHVLKILSKGDQLVLTKLDRGFKSRYECITTINQLLNEGINICTISGFNFSNNLLDVCPTIFSILYELEIFEKNIFDEKKREISDNVLLKGKNIGGRPKIGNLKEELVVRLRKEGFSYRAIRSQTGIALSTIRRIIIDYAVS